MKFRRTVIAVAALGLGLTLAHGARAGVLGQCVGTARQSRRQCVQACFTNFHGDVQTCLGPATDCVQTCLSAATTCKSGPLQAIDSCANDPNNPQSCASQVHAALVACQTDPDPRACAFRARILGFSCRRDCFDGQKTALDACRDTLRTCLAPCAPGSTTTTTTTPAPTTTTVQ